jgi:hypothetical protein
VTSMVNLNHLIERGVAVPDVQRALAENHQRAWVVSGGWCDRYSGDARAVIVANIRRLYQSVRRAQSTVDRLCDSADW